jgi:hypothetical protein
MHRTCVRAPKRKEVSELKKSCCSVLLVLALSVALNAQVAAQPKPEDLLKNLVVSDSVQPGPEKLKPGLDLINADDSIAMLTYISSDLMEGREAGTRGFQLAAEYAASMFSLWKLQPAGDKPAAQAPRGMMGGNEPPAPSKRSYFQELTLKETKNPSSRIDVQSAKDGSVKTKSFQSGIDFRSAAATTGTLEGPAVFAGYGIQEKSIGWDDFKGIDVKGKIVLVLSDAPGKDDPKSPFQQKELKDKYFPQPAPGARMGAPAGGFNKVQDIMKRGATAVLQVSAGMTDAEFVNSLSAVRKPSDDRPYNPRPRRRLSLAVAGPGAGPMGGPGAIAISREMADSVLEASGQTIAALQKKIDSSYAPASLVLPATRITIADTAEYSFVRCRNILAMIEGSDPVLKNEYVVIGAHYDHTGSFDGYVYNGADDNGSGSVGVMNAARAFAANPVKPKRSVIFALWTAEEMGLLGSRYYVQNPTFPIAKTVAYFNMDMISRPHDAKTLARTAAMFNFPAGKELFDKIQPADFLSVSISANAGFGDVFRNADKSVGLDMYLRESAAGQRPSGGTDHSSFAAVDVPWASVITAMTEDYHQTSDSVEKVSGELMARVSRLIYLAAFEVADR